MSVWTTQSRLCREAEIEQRQRDLALERELRGEKPKRKTVDRHHGPWSERNCSAQHRDRVLALILEHGGLTIGQLREHITDVSPTTISMACRNLVREGKLRAGKMRVAVTYTHRTKGTPVQRRNLVPFFMPASTGKSSAKSKS